VAEADDRTYGEVPFRYWGGGGGMEAKAGLMASLGRSSLILRGTDRESCSGRCDGDVVWFGLEGLLDWRVWPGGPVVSVHRVTVTHLRLPPLHDSARETGEGARRASCPPRKTRKLDPRWGLSLMTDELRAPAAHEALPPAPDHFERAPHGLLPVCPTATVGKARTAFWASQASAPRSCRTATCQPLACALFKYL
jgi:hypothetical protein